MYSIDPTLIKNHLQNYCVDFHQSSTKEQGYVVKKKTIVQSTILGQRESSQDNVKG